MRRILLFITLAVACTSLNAQDRTMDSLKLALKNAKHDTTRCIILNAMIEAENDDNVWPGYNTEMKKIAERGLKSNPANSTSANEFKGFIITALNNEGVLVANNDMPKAIECFDKAKAMYREMNDTTGIVISLNNLAAVFRRQGDIPKALECFHECLELAEKIGDKDLIANVLFNLNVNYRDLGETTKALDYLYRSMKIREEMGDKLGIAKCLRSISTVHTQQGDYEKGNELLFKSLKSFQELNAKNEIALTCNNLGTNFLELGDSTKALYYLTMGLEIFKELNNQVGVAVIIHNMARVYSDAGDEARALNYYFESLKIREKLGDKEGMASSLHTIGKIYYKRNDIAGALKIGQRSLELAQQVGNPEFIGSAAELLSDAYKKQGKYKEALEMHELQIAMRDSLSNQQLRKTSLQKQFQYQYAMKAAEDSVKVAEEKKVVAAQLKNEKTQRMSLYGGLALVTVFSLFMVNRFRVTNKQKKIIEIKEQETQVQKHMVEEKQREILDSISYAKRLQQAILPPEAFIRQYINDFFILYKPKDIVAGDFYFFDHRDGKIFIAAADSTGHGVPGAMVSVVCSNALNRTLNEFRITDPGKILDKTRELVVETFAKSESEVKDGMDISFCSIDLGSRKMWWSGANNPLWYLQDGQLLEIKADKQPIGKTYDPRPFTTHEVALQPGSLVYLITDGYADQFGGPKGKKYKYKQLEELLLGVQDRSMEEQRAALESSFTGWQGNLEQIDDVTIIGIRV